MLFTLGLLAKNFDVESEEFAEYKMCSKKELFEMYLFFIRSSDVDIQQKTLAGLGSFLTRYSEYMITEDVKKLYLNYIKSPTIPYALKSQVFSNLTDYLNEEDQRNLAKSVELSKNHGSKDDLKEMLDVQSGMASTIIQSYLKPILDSYLTPNINLRNHVFNCLSMILNQGLVYPIECVPYLIAMTTDDDKKIQARSLVHLTNLQKAHPGFVQSKSIAGVNVSFLLQKIIFKSQQQQQPQNVNTTAASVDVTTASTQSDLVIRGFSEQGELLSLNHHLYTLLRTNRSYRRAFSQQLLKMFDDSYSHKTSLAHMLYISDNLAYFPYQLIDEPLYLIHQIDIIISVTGINLLQTFKESLLNHRSTAEKTENQPQTQSEENIQAGDVDVNQDCPIEVDETGEENGVLNSNGDKINCENANLNSSQKKAALQEDDEDETYDTVFNNLPSDLKTLKDCMYKAQGCCLLLILKMFFKEVYSITDR
jgi:cohesin loading factor subunit SCC2